MYNNIIKINKKTTIFGGLKKRREKSILDHEKRMDCTINNFVLVHHHKNKLSLSQFLWVRLIQN